MADEDKMVLDLTISGQKTEFFQIAKNVIYQNNILECRRADTVISNFLKSKPTLESDNKKLFNEVKLLQTECQWVALPILEVSKVVNLYNKNINVAWEIPKKYEYYLDSGKEEFYYQKDIIKGKLEQLSTNISIYKDRDDLKNRIMDALKDNEEIMTKSRIIDDQSSFKPLLHKWFDVYFEKVGTGEINKLKQAEFFSEDKFFRKISEEEKAKLKLIFTLYENLKKSSSTPEGNEDRTYFIDEKGMGYIEAGNKEYYPKEDIEAFKKFHNEYKEDLLKAGIVDESFYEEKPKAKKETDNKTKNNNMHNDVPSYKQTDEPKGLTHDIFSDIDAQEIEEHKASGLAKQDSSHEAELIDMLKKKFSLEFEDENIEKRFENVVLTYLHGIRDAIEFKEMLTRSSNAGGMAYKTKMAEDIIGAIEEVEPGKKEEVHHDAPVIKDEDEKGAKPTGPVLNMAQAQAAIEKSAQAKRIAAKSGNTIKPKMPVAPPPPRTATLPTLDAIPQVNRLRTNKPVVKDITSPVDHIKLVGPEEELQAITLGKFRRMADNPVEATEKIREKIALLEEQSLAVKARGIVAFKNSALNKLYLKIGNASIEKGRSVQEVIQDLLSEGEKILTKEEFDAIADLNKKLRF